MSPSATWYTNANEQISTGTGIRRRSCRRQLGGHFVGISMAHNGLSNGLHAIRGHAKYDSALDAALSKSDADKMRDLEEQNHSLAERAAAASQRFADYENEIRVLQAQLRQQERRHVAAVANARATDASPPPPPPASEKPGISRFGSFIGARKPSLSPSNGAVQNSSTREKELEAALVKEKTARIAAEKKSKEVNAEIEELSATLFQQANEMVAAERKEKAALQNTIKVLERNRSQSDDAMKMENVALKEKMRSLEKKSASVDESVKVENERLKQKIQVMEQREVERKRRLERLEAAQKRIDRVRAMLRPR